MICCAASGAAPSITAAAPACLAASRLTGSMSTTIALCPPMALCRAWHIRPSPPAPMMTVGSVLSVGTFFKAPKVVTPEQASGATRSGGRSPMSNR